MLTKPNILRLVSYIVFFAAALYFPGRTVYNFERPAVPPVEMRFKLRAYDPYDPLRGRYLALNVICPPKNDKVKSSTSGRETAVLEKDRDGFAVVSELLPSDGVPPTDKPFVRNVHFAGFVTLDDNKNVTEIRGAEMPFDRFYLNEPLAKPAEKLLREVTRDPKRSAVLVVDIHRDGNWAVKELLVDGKPLREVLRAAAK